MSKWYVSARLLFSPLAYLLFVGALERGRCLRVIIVTLDNLAKLSSRPISALCSKFYPRNIMHMPAVKFLHALVSNEYSNFQDYLYCIALPCGSKIFRRENVKKRSVFPSSFFLCKIIWSSGRQEVFLLSHLQFQVFTSLSCSTLWKMDLQKEN